MNNEIKEMLDKLKEIKEPEIYITPKTTKKLLDYITNLQTIEQQYSAILSENVELENKIINLQQENERLRKKITIKKLGIKYKVQTPENFELRKIFELQRRIDKAVEYGNSCINKDLVLETLDEPYKTTFKTAYEIHNNYLDILNGRSDE